MAQWHNAGYKGIRYREHPTRKHKVNQPDRYYVLRYRIDGKRHEEPLGWASHGWTLQKAIIELSKLKHNQKLAEGPQTLKEKREKDKARREAEEQEKAIEKKDNTAFEVFWEDFYYPQAQHDKKPKSIERESYLFKLWIAPIIGEIPLKKVSPLDIEKLKSKMSSAKQSPRSIQYALSVIRQVFNHARRIGYFEGDPPTSKVKWPSVNNARLRYINSEEAETIFSSLKMKSPLVYEVSLISLHCGLRFEEIASLEWQDINLDEDFLIVRDPKNQSSRRAPITPMAKSMFKQKSRGKPSD